jgi:hypothetical protein
MVVLAPVSAAISRRYGAKVTLVTGALILAGGYVGRVFLVAQLWQIILGAALVSMGTAVAYAAMPTLIMRAVPITETASANGLNTLLRAIGTSTSSAVVAAVLTGTVMHLGPVTLPSLDAFKQIFWLAALAGLAAAAVALGLPGRRAAAPAVVGSGRVGTVPPQPVHDEVKADDQDHETVVRGEVHGISGRPIRTAVVTVLRIDGEPVDWARVDNTGAYAVALPGPGRYVVVTTADGWAPRSDVLELADPMTHQHIVLEERLCLTGVVRGEGSTQPGVLVTLTTPSGEWVASTRTDVEGAYELPLPGAGRYVLTVVEAASGRSTSTIVTVSGRPVSVDVELPEQATVYP